jgi:hypothetical protein
MHETELREKAPFYTIFLIVVCRRDLHLFRDWQLAAEVSNNK